MLTVQEMKEMIELFVHHKLHTLKIGDFEVQKSRYEPEKQPGDNKVFQDDPLFHSSGYFPDEVEALLASMSNQSKTR